jgi:acetyltransferase-like isoleucine patch superfamily enzyme
VRLRPRGLGRRGTTAPLERQLARWLEARPAPDPSAFATFGAGSWVVPPTEVHGAERIEVGDGVLVLEESTLVAGPDARIVLGAGVRLAPFASLHATVGIVVEAGVSTSDHVTIVDSWGPTPPAGPGAPPTGPGAAAVRIGAGAYLGCSSVVGPGVTIGPGAFVGEGAVVVEDVPAHAVVYGNPARVVRHFDPTQNEWSGRSPVGRRATG